MKRHNASNKKKGDKKGTSTSSKRKKKKGSNRASKINPAWVVFIIVVVVALGVVIRTKFLKQDPTEPVAYKQPSAHLYTAADEHDQVPVSQWEADFQSTLWTRDAMQRMKTDEATIFQREGAIIKSVTPGSDSKELRVLVFDNKATEVQGVAEFEAGVHNPSSLVLEYIRSMVLSLGFMQQGVSCRDSGRALVLGLGAGTLANFMHAKFPEFDVDVVEVSQDVYDANIEVMGTVEDARFRVHLKDAGEIFVGNTAEYDVVFLDAYLPGPIIPPRLVTPDYIAELRGHLSVRGVLIFNFCTSYYKTKEAQRAVLQPLMDAFDHVHQVEATWQSKIIVAYSGRPRVTRESWQFRYRQWVDDPACVFPVANRGAGYEVYLSDDDRWIDTFKRNLHQESTQMYCRKGKISEQYCAWFDQNGDAIYTSH